MSSSGCRGEGLTTGLLGGLLTGLLVLFDLVGAGCLTGSISPSNNFFIIFLCYVQTIKIELKEKTSNKMGQKN